MEEKTSKLTNKTNKNILNKQREKSNKRIFKEYKNIVDDTIVDIIMVDEKINCFHIRFTPKGGHYINQTLILELKTKHPAQGIGYPYKPPLIKLLTPVFHTNVSKTGIICVDFIYNSEKWNPTYGFTSIITAIILLFDEPEFTQGHYNPSASSLYRECLKIKSFEAFDTKTKKYYNEFIQKGGNKILDEFNKNYKQQHPKRNPVGL